MGIEWGCTSCMHLTCVLVPIRRGGYGYAPNLCPALCGMQGNRPMWVPRVLNDQLLCGVQDDLAVMCGDP